MPICANPSCAKAFVMPAMRGYHQPKRFCQRACWNQMKARTYPLRTARAKEQLLREFRAEFGSLTPRELDIARKAWNAGKWRGYRQGWHRAKRAA